MSNKRSESIEDLAITFLDCRDKGHHWRHLTDKITVGSRARVREVRRFYECKGCSCQQEELIALPSCEVTSRRYIYPDGYLLRRAPGDAPISVRDVRREVFGRSGLKF